MRESKIMTTDQNQMSAYQSLERSEVKPYRTGISFQQLSIPIMVLINLFFLAGAKYTPELLGVSWPAYVIISVVLILSSMKTDA